LYMNSRRIKRPDQNYSPCAQLAKAGILATWLWGDFFIDHHSRQDYIGKNNTRLTLLIQLWFWLQRLKNQSSGVFIHWLFFIPSPRHGQRRIKFHIVRAAIKSRLSGVTCAGACAVIYSFIFNFTTKSESTVDYIYTVLWNNTLCSTRALGGNNSGRALSLFNRRKLSCLVCVFREGGDTTQTQ